MRTLPIPWGDERSLSSRHDRRLRWLMLIVAILILLTCTGPVGGHILRG